jgi:hypothetical protein
VRACLLDIINRVVLGRIQHHDVFKAVVVHVEPMHGYE